MNKLIDLASHENIKLEVFARTANRLDINTLNGRVRLFQTNKIKTYNIKAIINGSSVSLVTESISNPKKIIEQLKSIAEIQENNNENRLCEGNFSKKLEKLEKLNFNEIKKDFLSLNNLREDYPCIVDIETNYSNYFNGYSIKGKECSLEQENSFNEYVVSITIKKGEISRILYLSYYTKEYDFAKFVEYIKEKMTNFLVKLDSDTCESKKYKVILTNNVVTSILEHFASHFCSKAICLNSSLLINKLNKKIFSDKINIVEDAKNGIVSRCFDNEGTITNYQELVVNGVFKKEVNDIEYALKLNRKATGNSYGLNNLYIKPGNKNFANLVEELSDGIIIDEVFGLHSGIDDSTGIISLQAEGLVVNGGKIKSGLTQIVLSTDLFEVFTNVLDVGNDLEPISAKVSAPSLLLDNISIIGGK